MADLILPRGEQKVLKAEDKDYNRGLLVRLLDNGGYDMAYWYNKPDKPYPVEVLVDGKSIKKDAKVVEMKFHPKDYYDKVEENTMEEARGSCWVGYKQIGMKKKNGRLVPNCVKEVVDIYWENQNESCGYTFEFEKQPMSEAEYKGRKVKLNKIMQGDKKKFKVYVRNDKGNVVKVEYGDPNMSIKRDDPARRKSFRARHNCDNPGPKYKARYWSCKFWEKGKSVTDLMKG